MYYSPGFGVRNDFMVKVVFAVNDAAEIHPFTPLPIKVITGNLLDEWLSASGVAAFRAKFLPERTRIENCHMMNAPCHRPTRRAGISFFYRATRVFFECKATITTENRRIMCWHYCSSDATIFKLILCGCNIHFSRVFGKRKF